MRDCPHETLKGTICRSRTDDLSAGRSVDGRSGSAWKCGCAEAAPSRSWRQMTAATTSPAFATPSPTGPLRRAVGGPTDLLAELEPEPSQVLELDMISAQWQVALDAAEAALCASVGLLNPSEQGLRRTRLAQERRETALALIRLARVAGVQSPLPTAPLPASSATHLVGQECGTTAGHRQPRRRRPRAKQERPRSASRGGGSSPDRPGRRDEDASQHRGASLLTGTAEPRPGRSATLAEQARMSSTARRRRPRRR
jgi:hypothetical protein